MTFYQSSPKIRLSEVGDLISVDASEWLEFKKNVQRLATDGQFVVFGCFNPDFTCEQNLTEDWSEVSPNSLMKATWDWETDRLTFDPHAVPEGTPPDYSIYEHVSLKRIEVETFLTSVPNNNANFSVAKKGAKARYNWELIETVAKQFADSRDFLSANIFYSALEEYLEKSNIPSPSISSFKSRQAIKSIANKFSQ